MIFELKKQYRKQSIEKWLLKKKRKTWKIKKNMNKIVGNIRDASTGRFIRKKIIFISIVEFMKKNTIKLEKC